MSGAQAGISPNIDTQQLINWYTETDPQDTRTPKYIVPTPGNTLFCTAGSGVIRGLYVFNSLLYAVSGNTLYEITTGGVATSRGTLGTSTGVVQFCDNGPTQGTQMMIIDGSSSYYTFVAGAGSLVSHTGSNFTTAATLTYQDGYGIFNQNDLTGRFWLTNLEDMTTITGTNFATLTSTPSQLVAVISDSVRLYLLGSQSLEVWYNSGDPNFTFTRVPNSIYFRGCNAAYSVQKLDNSIIWLGTTSYGHPQIYQMRGEAPPIVISTPQMEYTMSQYSKRSDAISFAMIMNGHEFYVVTFPTANVTWVYDCRTREWHNRQSGASGRWIANCFAFFNSNYYIGDFNATGNIYQLSQSATTENGVAINRTLTSPHFNDKDERLFVNSVQVVGNFQAVANASTMTLTYSKDNGLTFPSTQTFTTSSSNNIQRMIFRRLGWARDWVFRLTTTSNPVISDAFVHIENRTEGRPGNAGGM